MAEAAAKILEIAKPMAVEDKTPKKKADLLGILLLVLVCVNLAALGGMGYFLRETWKRIHELQATVASAKPAEAPVDQANPIGRELQPQSLGILYPIESFLVNIASDQGPKFLQAQLEFELTEPALEDEIARKKPAIRDAIIVMLSSRSYREIRDAGGMKRLRSDLLRTVNGLLSTGKIKEIYFTQFHFN